MKRVSIVTVNLNNLEGLRRTVFSVLGQDWTDFEFIVVDGGSTDGSVAFLEEQGKLFSYWVSEPDSGVYEAMNKGIRKANGEYLLFLNSGDYLASSTVLTDVLTCLDGTPLVYGDLLVNNKRGEMLLYEFPERISINYLLNNYLPHPGTFFHRSVFEKVGLYNEHMEYAADWQIGMKAIYQEGLTSRHVPVPISVFNLDGKSSEAGSYNNIEQEKTAFLLENRELLNQDFFDRYWLNHRMLQMLRKSRLIKILISLGFLGYLKSYFQQTREGIRVSKSENK